ncbi:unnamed protein product [Cyclocybe aegerita]|uniref:Uncharacterized protein n=1 Tax=Cyclocybe aegerita TaxID=1973307 RepID=A0A8S0XJ03_CYCAE|nr:unnamed protein product [Cyclocybe aegerita]
MESLNLNTLANSLPTAQQNAEKELLNDFKAAALSITTLYRSSRKTSKRAYNAGYLAACQDLLNFIQQGVSTSDVGQAPSGSTAVEGGGLTIGRVMDWTEARLEAIKAREEEEDEEEEKERAQPRSGPPVAAHVAPKSEGKKAVPAASVQRSKESGLSLPTPSSPVTHPSSHPPPPEPSSPSPPASSSSTCAARPAKSRHTPPAREAFQPSLQSSNLPPSPFLSEPFPTAAAPFSAEAPINIGAGAKRRHAMMMMIESAAPVNIGGPSSTVSSPGGTLGASCGIAGSSLGRRRTRSSRNIAQLQNQNINLGSEAMDVEEDGRERKRVARR